jgi:hypothetical protein
VVHSERTQQAAVFIPLPADTVQPTVAIAQFFGQLTVEMPGSVKAMKFPIQLPDFPVDSPVAVIKPLYAKLRHFGKLTVLPAVLLSGVGTGRFFQPAVRTLRVFQKGWKKYSVIKLNLTNFGMIVNRILISVFVLVLSNH